MASIPLSWKKLRLRVREGLPLRYTMMLVVVIGVTLPAMLLLTLEQQLAEKSQKALLTQSETALMKIGSVSIAEPMWVVDRVALDAAAARLLESPQVVAVRIEDGLANTPEMERIRPDFAGSLDKDTAAGRLTRRTQSVIRSGEPLGTLVVWFDASYGQGLLQARRDQMLVLVALQVLAILAVLMPVLVSRVLRPIERLKEHASALLDHSRDDGPGQVFVWRRQDELGLLGRHLGRVQEELRGLFTQLGNKNAQLQQMAFYDQLTGLPNRSLFIDLVQREMLSAQRNDQQFGIFFIDLDRFKAVNDSMGHAAGDALLIEVARRLREVLREVDVVCRQSGDEFLVLVRDIEHWESLGEMAQRVLRSIEAPVVLANAPVKVSASIGISLYPEDGQDFETLVKHADIAVYQAKTLGRARYSYFHSELNSRLQANLELEQELAYAIGHDQLVLHYQPQVSAKTGEMVAVEALVRWQHPSRGLLYPAQFIGLAEESGRIAEMGVWTLREACRQLADWSARGIHIGNMAVNVSALEFRDHRLLDSLQAALDASGIPPQRLEIEITESVLMAETETSQRIIERLRQIGVGIAIDDFGTGYSSLAYLKRLRPNQLKIDRSFVNDTATDSDSRAIVKGVVGLAEALSLNVVAEGVETEEQRAFLQDIGCHTLQGYWIAKPLTVEALEQWLLNRRT
ncbi:putative bifunctional diguanylate cyclase/phosphodiesterase [Rhodoferax mekongensis]|uniref:putative bifunctional diguanylate cyclase/phosphodiesterase n=1 Tax=Rhodoferax mekongensis TaxID=3068341 RepID=UPI0028BE4259|nr:EAL domain-containing protein [Rhodoferax sp. TBRC 17199]MDT7513681.1 EAL domain-containing protein [Rhodoferax sp. TBRC 17199]